MAEKFHINPKTGRPGKCTATKQECKFGGNSNHFPSKEAAQKAIEKALSGFVVPDKLKRPTVKATEKAKEVVKTASQSSSLSCSSGTGFTC